MASLSVSRWRNIIDDNGESAVTAASPATGHAIRSRALPPPTLGMGNRDSHVIRGDNRQGNREYSESFGHPSSGTGCGLAGKPH